MCSETASPRVSFSNDLAQDQSAMDQKESRRDDKLLLDSARQSPDFEFRFCSNFVQESSSADELFSNGMILPFQSKNVPRPEPPNGTSNSNPGPPASVACVEADSKKSETQKSFWGFKRSASLNSDKKKGLICSLPLLSRSNSTGSVQNQRPKSVNKQGSQKQSSSSSRSYQFPQKPPLKKNNVHGGSYGNGNGVRISPVLNVPPNLLGFGSFMRNGKDKKMKK